MMDEFPRKYIVDGDKKTIVIQTRHEALCERFNIPLETPEEEAIKMWNDLQKRGREAHEREIEREKAEKRVRDFDAGEVEKALRADSNNANLTETLLKLTQVISDIQLTRGFK
jgi:hypothetical protein